MEQIDYLSARRSQTLVQETKLQPIRYPPVRHIMPQPLVRGGAVRYLGIELWSAEWRYESRFLILDNHSLIQPL